LRADEQPTTESSATRQRTPRAILRCLVLITPNRIDKGRFEIARNCQSPLSIACIQPLISHAKELRSTPCEESAGTASSRLAGDI
jgi:hypothetical protein